MDGWEESDSSLNNELEQNDGNMFSDSELFEALEEYQGKRKSSRILGSDSPKRPKFLLNDGFMILPYEDNHNQSCSSTLDKEQSLVTFNSSVTTKILASDETARIEKPLESVSLTAEDVENQNSPKTFFELQTLISVVQSTNSEISSEISPIINDLGPAHATIEHIENQNYSSVLTIDDVQTTTSEISRDLSPATDNTDDKDYQPEAETAGSGTSLPESLIDDVPFDGNAHEEKKRKTDNDRNWKVRKNKKLRMLGKSYLGFRRTNEGKVFHDVEREKRKMGPPCNSPLCRKSKQRACDQITEEMRQNLFDSFWKTMNWDQRRTFIVNSVEKNAVKRRKTLNEESRRESSLHYYLTIDGIRKKVCMVTYLNTFAIKKWTVRYWIDHKPKNDGIAPSASVTHPQTARVSSTRKKRHRDFVKQFFNSLPKMPSHYCRESTTRKYLEPIVTSMAQLYNLYLERLPQENANSVSRFTFESIFKQENLSLFNPRKDQCDICCSYKAGNVPEEEYTKHIEEKDRARKEKNDDKEKAKAGEVHVFTQDVQATKLAPLTKASAFYYKKKLNVHNFTMYNLLNHDVSCYWFDETASDLSSSTFASCIIDTLSNILEQKRLPIILWSDGCNYQNRNSVLSNVLLIMSYKYEVTIEQKYLTKGHTQMECDSVHSSIEAKLRNKDISLPGQYSDITKEARSRPTPYKSFFLEHTFFKDFSQKEFQIYDSIRPGKIVGDPTVVNLKAIKYCNGEISVKINFDAEYSPLPRRQRKNIIDCSLENAPPLNPERRKISKSKWLHLQELKSSLTFDCHPFYDQIPHEDSD